VGEMSGVVNEEETKTEDADVDQSQQQDELMAMER
jgi:hypothetical protein